MNSETIQITCFDDSRQDDSDLAIDSSIKAWQNFLQKIKKFFVFYLQPESSNIAKQSQFNLIIINTEQMTELNNRFRRANYPTDVLTFSDTVEPEVEDPNDDDNNAPLLENNSQNKKNKERIIQYNTDIFICLQVAIEQASKQNIPLEYELTLLALHGLLHAVGLDHETSDDDAKEMNRLERVMLSLLEIPESVALTKI